MAYDRYDTREPRDERSRWRDDDRDVNRSPDRERGYGGGRDDRGFFERAGDEIASWFGDDEAERRRRQDQTRDSNSERGSSSSSRDRDHDRGYGRDWNRERSMGSNRSGDHYPENSAFSRGSEHDRGGGDWDRDRGRAQARDRDWNDNRGAFARGGSSDRDYNRSWRQEFAGTGSGRMERDEQRDRDFGRHDAERGRSSRGYESSRERDEYMQRGQDFDRGRDQGGAGYRPLTGDYGRSSSDFGGMDRGGSHGERSNRSQSNWDRDEYRETSRAGTANKSDRSRDDRFDPHYSSWRDRHLSDLDRDYDDYRAENRSKFESDFGSWRERREQKRGLLGEVREHMEVVGSDKKHVGTVDKTAGDRVILTKSDAESGMQHSISCSDIDRVEGDKVFLDCSADQARERWRDENRGRALFEGDDQGEAGPRALDRSFQGTYR